MNKIMLIGNLCRNPELKTLPSGTKVATFTIAVSSARKDQTDFFNIACYNKQAELVEQFIEKGSKVAVWGSIHIKTYNRKDGTKGTDVNVEVENIEFLNFKEKETVEPQIDIEPEEDDDLPF